MATQWQILDRMAEVVYRHQHATGTSLHLLQALLEFPDDPAVAVLIRNGCSTATLAAVMKRKMYTPGHWEFKPPGTRWMSGVVQEVMKKALACQQHSQSGLDDGRYLIRELFGSLGGDHMGYLRRTFDVEAGTTPGVVLAEVMCLPNVVHNVVIIE